MRPKGFLLAIALVACVLASAVYGQAQVTRGNGTPPPTAASQTAKQASDAEPKTWLDRSVYAAVIGALLGACGAWIANQALEQRRIRDKAQRLHCLLLDEIVGHQAPLDRTVDAALPYWLLRGRVDIHGDPIDYLKRAKLAAPRFSAVVYDKFASELIYSTLAVPLVNYYRGVEGLNWFHEHQASGKGLDAASYLVESAWMLEASALAVDDILKIPGIQRYFTARLKNSVDYYQHRTQHYRLLVALTQVSPTDFSRLLEFQRDPANAPPGVRAILNLGIDPGHILDTYGRSAAAIQNAR